MAPPLSHTLNYLHLYYTIIFLFCMTVIQKVYDSHTKREKCGMVNVWRDIPSANTTEADMRNGISVRLRAGFYTYLTAAWVVGQFFSTKTITDFTSQNSLTRKNNTAYAYSPTALCPTMYTFWYSSWEKDGSESS